MPLDIENQKTSALLDKKSSIHLVGLLGKKYFYLSYWLM